MTRVALIACDHGLGHVRRAVLVAEALASRESEVDVLAPAGAAERIRRALGIARSGAVRDVPFATLTTPASLRDGAAEAARWEERLPDLDRYDVVISDNLPEVLDVREDAVLVAQFLWHDVIDGIHPEIQQRAARLVRSARLVVGSLPFAMPAVRALPGFRPVGLHASPVGAERDRSGGELLVTGGSTPVLADGLRNALRLLADRRPEMFSRVLVDPALLPERAPGWMQPADYSAHMFGGLSAALVRPGLGVVTELVARAVPMWCTYEAGNAEMRHNAAVLTSLGLGGDLGALAAGADAGWPGRIARTLSEGGPPRSSATASAEIALDGVAATADLVLEGS